MTYPANDSVEYMVYPLPCQFFIQLRPSVFTRALLLPRDLSSLSNKMLAKSIQYNDSMLTIDLKNARGSIALHYAKELF